MAASPAKAITAEQFRRLAGKSPLPLLHVEDRVATSPDAVFCRRPAHLRAGEGQRPRKPLPHRGVQRQRGACAIRRELSRAVQNRCRMLRRSMLQQSCRVRGARLVNVCFEPKSFAVEFETDKGKEPGTKLGQPLKL